jgi:uncharacterized protein YndB with AHSA1/START domain
MSAQCRNGSTREADTVQGDVVSVERAIAATPAAIFAVVADASRHPEIDGSGTVVKAKPAASHELGLGSVFGMSMKMGVPYVMSNTVIEFEQDRRIAWQTVLSGFLGRFVGGRIWRFELEPAADGSTLVRESWDISQDKQSGFLRRGKVPAATAEGMTKSLENLARATEAPVVG